MTRSIPIVVAILIAVVVYAGRNGFVDDVDVVDHEAFVIDSAKTSLQSPSSATVPGKSSAAGQRREQPDPAVPVDDNGETVMSSPAGKAADVGSRTIITPADQSGFVDPALVEADMAGESRRPLQQPLPSAGPSTADRRLAGPNLPSPGGQLAVEAQGLAVPGGVGSMTGTAPHISADPPGPSQQDLALPGPGE